MNALDAYRRLHRQWLRLRVDATATESEVDIHLEALDLAWQALDDSERSLINTEAARWAQRIRTSLPMLIDVRDEAGASFPRRRAEEAA